MNVLSDEERRGKKNTLQRKYRERPEVKAKRREYNKRPERKAKKREYNKRPERKAKRREYDKLRSLSPERKAQRREHNARPEVKAKRREYDKLRSLSPERKAQMNEYNASPKGKARMSKRTKEKKDDVKMEVCLHYSKIHSNSNIPCCRCCGYNSHIEFLNLDHISGRKEMDSKPELVKLGYSSKLPTQSLQIWIKKNNFPKGFQVLCVNCNFAKGHSKDNKCPHERD